MTKLLLFLPTGKPGPDKDTGRHSYYMLSTKWIFLGAGAVCALVKKTLGLVVSLGLELECHCAK